MSVPPPNSEDQSLLCAWAERADESAFRALVQRHLGMVQATALRRVEREPLAQDVSQSVFALLARRAGKLVSHPCLAGWLHRTATLEASNVLRRELKHRRLMNTLAREKPDAGSDPLEGVAPHLDAAIESMPEADRHALFLRFTERLSFDAMGARLGKSADACQKQTSRALDRLASILRRRGALLSVTALGAAITAGTAKPVSAAVIAAVSEAALKASAQLPALTILHHSLHAMSTIKQCTAAAAVVVLVSAWPLSSQWSEAASLRIGMTLRSPQLSSAPAKTRPLRKSTAAGSPETGPQISMDTTEADEFLALLDGLDAKALASHELIRLIESLMSLPPSHMQPAMVRISKLKNVVYNTVLSFALFSRWGELDPKAALAVKPASVLMESLSSFAIAQGWIETDPRGLLKNLKDERFRLRSVGEQLVPAIARLDPELASEFLAAIPSRSSVPAMMKYIIDTDPDHFEERVAAMLKGVEPPKSGGPRHPGWDHAEHAVELLTARDPMRAMNFATGLFGDEGALQVLFRWSRKDPPDALAWLEQQPAERQSKLLYSVQDAVRAMSAAERSDFLNRGPEENRIHRLTMTAHVIASTFPEEAAALAATVPAGQQPKTYERVAAGWAENNPRGASEWVDSLPPGAGRDHAITGFTRKLVINDPQSAMTWAANIGDAALRSDVQRKRIAMWLHEDRRAAETWMQTSTAFTPEERDSILAAKNLPLER